MDINDVIAFATEGLSEDQAKPIREALLREGTKQKFATVKAQKEYEALQTERDALNASIEGGPNEPGLKAFKKWYGDNGSRAVELSKKEAEFIAKHGRSPYDEPANPNPANPNPAPLHSKEDIQRIAKEELQVFSLNTAAVVKNLVKAMDRHHLNKRATPFDVDAIEKIMAEKQIPIEAAYDEWDKPEREKASAAELKATVDQKVREELAKRGTNQNFPVADAGAPSPISHRSAEGFDKQKFRESLMQTFATGEKPSVQ